MKRWSILFAAAAAGGAGCYVQDVPAHNNGLDGQLSFGARFSTTAVGATNHLTVLRSVDGEAHCRAGKGGDICTGGAGTVAVVIDSASCGDGCTAQIVPATTGALATVDVTPSAAGDVTLAVSVHAASGGGSWTDRYVLHATPPRALVIVPSSYDPFGAGGYATEVGARAALYVCPIATDGLLPGSTADGATCLGGDFARTVSGDGVVQVTPSVALAAEDPLAPSPSYFGVQLAAAGQGTLHVQALGLTRAIAMRAAAPSEWKAIQFVRLGGQIAVAADLEGKTPTAPAIFDVTIDSAAIGAAHPVAAIARLADGTPTLLSRARIACTPSTRAAVRPPTDSGLPEWNADHVGQFGGDLEPADWSAVSLGDATCAVTGAESLGSLAVHVR